MTSGAGNLHSASFKADLSKVLSTDAKDAVLRWADTAPEEELKVVTKFFQQVDKSYSRFNVNVRNKR